MAVSILKGYSPGLKNQDQCRTLKGCLHLMTAATTTTPVYP